MPLSLRFYVALMMTAAVVGACAVGTRIYRHEAAIRRIEALGGTVDRTPCGPAWLRKWPGGGWVARAFDDAVHVNLRYCRVTDAHL